MGPSRRSKRRRLDHTAESAYSSALDKEWPPNWSVSFSDMTTLLMTCFILWYSLTAMRIPTELLELKGTTKITPGNIELAKKIKEIQPMVSKDFVAKVEGFTPEQRMAAAQARRVKELEDKVMDFLRTNQLTDNVNIKVGINYLEITPLEVLLFPLGKAELTSQGKAVVEQLGRLILSFPVQLVVEGHADPASLGPWAQQYFPSNWELSIARAARVAQALINQGIAPGRLGISGYADTKPQYPNDSQEHRALNRRVNIHIKMLPEEMEAQKESKDGLS